MNKTDVIVTGSNGQLGQELKNCSKRYGFNFKFLPRHKLNIVDEKSIIKAIVKYRPRAIINAAAYTNVDNAEKDIQECTEVNSLGPCNLAKICKENHILLIHISTDFVFDGFKGSPYIETDALNPLNTYGISKLKGEDFIQSLTDKYIIIRASWIFGVHGNNFLKKIIDVSSQRKVLNIVDDQEGCPTSTESLAICILDLCSIYFLKTHLPYGIYHFSNSPQTNWYEFAEYFLYKAKEIGLIQELPELVRVSSEEFNSPSIKPKYSVLSTKKITKTFKFNQVEWKKEVNRVLKTLYEDNYA
ncbi:dTDP-4-dehydrorhamnose reductase [Gammaproteobacteria bacterium]|nr:dTDP-4-dehydrorhamnose reductase [Gammaproteobacteria bacterium]